MSDKKDTYQRQDQRRLDISIEQAFVQLGIHDAFVSQQLRQDYNAEYGLPKAPASPALKPISPRTRLAKKEP